ncbi:aspartate kinase [Thermopetrobacter sp. TC1]|uniref:aspartate kinase n=1 Tax=Thermopetrobacter sp. TC1 TaxID=1495045 RepID=UPI00056F0BCA|nr:aspartate kinase [Thermopetrobacter sp. TC1]
MSRLVMKFGGTSVADLDRIRNVARHVKREVEAGHQVSVVVSAMAGKTNELVAYCENISPLYDAREYDVVVASGEQVTSGLLAMTLQEMGIPARSWQGWQVPVKTDGMHGAARIMDIPPDNLVSALDRGMVNVIAGFQGIGPDGRITTLGRGGSDTSAVAVAAALGARCDIYTDVDGVYTTDPRIVSKARRIERISYEEMLELASLGAKVLQTRSVELAMVHKVPLRVRSSFDDPDSPFQVTEDGRGPGTLVCDEDEIMEQQVVSGIAYSRDEAQVAIRRVKDKPGVSASIFGPLADAGISVDMIVQNVSADGVFANLTFTVARKDLPRALKVLEENREQIGYEEIASADNVAKVSIVGIGMRSHAGVAAKMFRTLAEKGINIEAITTSEIKVSVLIDEAYLELALRALHSAYGLDAA